MSQQINLLDPRLRSQRDWLSLPLVAAVALALLLVEGGIFAYSKWQAARLSAEEANVSGEAKSLRQQVEALDKVLAERKPNSDLARDVAAMKVSLAPREEALQRLKAFAADPGFSEYLRGFSRQALEGVWLTGFSIGKTDFVIRGRLSDPSLLPAYIRHLNAEPAFQGRRFAALDMKGVEPAPLPPAAAAPAPGAAAGTAAAQPAPTAPRLPPYVEFVLQSTPPAAAAVKAGS